MSSNRIKSSNGHLIFIPFLGQKVAAFNRNEWLFSPGLGGCFDPDFAQSWLIPKPKIYLSNTATFHMYRLKRAISQRTTLFFRQKPIFKIIRQPQLQLLWTCSKFRLLMQFVANSLPFRLTSLLRCLLPHDLNSLSTAFDIRRSSKYSYLIESAPYRAHQKKCRCIPHRHFFSKFPILTIF